jgi:hypothetical protein
MCECKKCIGRRHAWLAGEGSWRSCNELADEQNGASALKLEGSCEELSEWQQTHNSGQCTQQEAHRTCDSW